MSGLSTQERLTRVAAHCGLKMPLGAETGAAVRAESESESKSKMADAGAGEDEIGTFDALLANKASQ